MNENAKTREIKRITKETGIEWRSDANRHNFGSYRLAMVRSFDQVFIVLPEHFQLFPSISHTVERNGGVAEIIIAELVPVPTHFSGISRAPANWQKTWRTVKQKS
jgi:hypothetical protein